jgi:hypothetical protein
LYSTLAGNLSLRAAPDSAAQDFLLDRRQASAFIAADDFGVGMAEEGEKE